MTFQRSERALGWPCAPATAACAADVGRVWFPGLKFNTCHIRYYMRLTMRCSHTNKKHIIYSVSNPRDKFIKSN
jgi:hypothetical protein